MTAAVAPLHPSRAPPTTEVLLLPSIPYGGTVEAVCQSGLSSLASDSVSLMSPTHGDGGRV